MNLRPQLILLTIAIWFLTGSISQAGNAIYDIHAIRFLGKVDCWMYPESQSVLIGALSDHREEVRFEAVKALNAQLQHGKPLIDPTLGWRPFPDPEILTQITRVARCCRLLTFEEIYQRYSERELAKRNQRECHRGDVCHNCCTPEVVQALSNVAYGRTEYGCFAEPSERVREAARRALLLCCDECQMAPTVMAPTPSPELPPEPAPAEPPISPETEAQPPEVPEPETAQLPPAPTVDPSTFAFVQRGRSGRSSRIPMGGRADLANRLNIFDNMTVEPVTRAWYGIQFAASANPATFISEQNQAFINLLANPPVDSGDYNFPLPALTPDEYTEIFGGRPTRYVQRPDSVLQRFGFEYALTPDFSFGMQAQYWYPTEDVAQPEFWSNPQVFLKHALFRNEKNSLVSMLSISPQIPKPKFAINEDTTRINPGLLGFHEFNEDWYSIGAFGFSYPTESNQVKTFDFALSLNHWLYRHESLDRDYQGPECRCFLMGVIPHVEVLGKSVLNDTRYLGFFDTFTTVPSNPDGRPFVLPDGSPITEPVFYFDEPRHIIDLTVSSTFILFRDWYLTTGVSVPLTGGSARTVEFLGTLNYYF